MNKLVNKQHQKGFTLLESLISLVVLSIGMLGIAALYVEGLRAGRTALYRTTAVTLAADLMDRIRANRGALVAYAGAPGLNNCVNQANDCTPAEMAAHDLQLWLDDIDARMPPGSDTAVVFVPGPIVNTYRIQIEWPEPGYDQPLTYTLEARM
ncbi:MAG: type IV pilus modification protein PilV [Gammaproteobacteria bacterium]|nr:type IV pilus modification protein PilV [Gammaproteobacteria bacterium]